MANAGDSVHASHAQEDVRVVDSGLAHNCDHRVVFTIDGMGRQPQLFDPGDDCADLGGRCALFHDDDHKVTCFAVEGKWVIG